MADNQQPQQLPNSAKAESNELSVKEVILTLKAWLRYLRGKWKIIILFVILGLALGAVYSISKTTLYRAEATFVLDEGGGSSRLSSLSALGLDVGNSSAGLFTATDNIIWLYTSRLMLQKTLLKEVEYKKRKRLLIDIYLDESGLRKAIQKYPEYRGIKFNPGITNSENLSIQQNALISWCAGGIKGEYLSVTEVKNTENIITVVFTSKDELFSKVFTDELVKTVNTYYINTRTKKTTEEVAVLQSKADSTRMLMDRSMYQAASAVDAEPYANPNRQVLRVAPQKKQVDVQVASAMYIELMKNLETRRMALAQETPLIQVVDSPVLPLPASRPPLIKSAILGGVLFTFLIVLILMVRYWFRQIMANPVV